MAEEKQAATEQDGHGVIAMEFAADPNRKRGESYKVTSRKWLIRDPDGKPGETIWVDQLPPEREKALGDFIFGVFSSALLPGMLDYLDKFRLQVADLSKEQWTEFVHAAWDLKFSTRKAGQLDEAKIERLYRVLKEVLTQKLERLQQKPAKKPTRSKKK
jgi:hypothetical protein